MDYQACVPLKSTFIYIWSAAAEYVYLPTTLLPAKPAPAESIQQSPHLYGSQSANPAPPRCQSAQICPQHEPSRTPSLAPVPQ
ncbi:hypothetical protein Tco_0899630 [Tanacetum coccineum]